VEKAVEYFVARQPILDRRLRSFAYELLFRSSMENSFAHHDPSFATRNVIASSFLLSGLRALTGGKKAFVNVTREILLEGDVTLLPSEQIVVEVLESVEPDPSVLRALRELRKKGYTIALDDFVCTEESLLLAGEAHIIKLDFLGSSSEDRRRIVDRFSGRPIQFLAEKVETEQQVQEAFELGCVYLQGYFFSRPVIMRGKDIPSFKSHHLRMLREIQQPDLDLIDLERILRQDLAIVYKLLRYVNSASIGLRREVDSLPEALHILGENEIRKLISLILVTSLTSDRPEQLLQDSVVRARLAETLAKPLRLQHRRHELFLLGLFSMLDAIIGRPMAEISRDLPISADVKDALISLSGSLAPVLGLVTACERGDWDRAAALADDLHTAIEVVAASHLEAIAWALEELTETGRDGGTRNAA
jgi:EAL and modified HD-GYP domain-containing signal transduction protein